MIRGLIESLILIASTYAMFILAAVVPDVMARIYRALRGR